MKQIIFSVVTLLSAMFGKAQGNLTEQQARYEVSTWTFAKTSLPYDDKISTQNALVKSYDSITMRVLRNTEGQAVKTLRYYTAIEVLPLHIQTRLSKRFSDYLPTAIIEQYDITGVNYIINVSKGNRWMQVHISSKGRLRILGQYHNSLLTESHKGHVTTLP